MIETITPAGCGGRRRQHAALAWFSAGAMVAAASVGFVAGVCGAVAGRRVALAVAVVVTFLAIAGQATGGRWLPQRRAQVPEAWRRTRPLWQWSSGYGAILGVGALTYQPFAAAWVALAAAASLSSPYAGVAAMVAFAVGRTVMVIVPTAGQSPRVGSVVSRGRLARILVAPTFAAGMFAFAGQAVGAIRPPEIDGTASGSVVAVTRVGKDQTVVIIRRPDHPSRVIVGASQPSLEGSRLAVRDSEGIRVLDWATGRTIARIRGRVTSPALAWPRIAFRRREGNRWLLVARDLSLRTVRILDSRPLDIDLGRPAMRGDLVVWHVTSARESVLVASRYDGAPFVVLRSTTRVASSPTLGNTRLAWIEDDATCSRVVAGPVDGGPVTLVAATARTKGVYWNVHLGRGTASVTLWRADLGTARILRFPLDRGPIDGCTLTSPRDALPPIGR